MFTHSSHTRETHLKALRLKHASFVSNTALQFSLTRTRATLFDQQTMTRVSLSTPLLTSESKEAWFLTKRQSEDRVCIHCNEMILLHPLTKMYIRENAA
jgi:hypothetical protein